MAIPLKTVQMDPNLARAKYEEYLPVAPAEETKAVVPYSSTNADAHKLSKLDIQLRDTYKAIMEDQQVINLRESLILAGEDDKHRPAVAIARADWRTVVCQRFQNGALRFSAPGKQERSDHTYEFVANTLPRIRNNDFVPTAVVPTIPPKLRPDNLPDFTLLWEPLWTGEPRPVPNRVAQWLQNRADAMAAVNLDPILLRPLGGNLYVVITHWDLTPIEAAILGQL